MSQPAGSYRHWRAVGTLNSGTPVTVHTCPNVNTTTFVTKITLSITTHASQTVSVKGSGSGTVIAAHTDITPAAAGIPSVVTWDFGTDVDRYEDIEGGVALTKGDNVQIVTSGAGPSGIVYIEGYDVKPI